MRYFAVTSAIALIGLGLTACGSDNSPGNAAVGGNGNQAGATQTGTAQGGSGFGGGSSTHASGGTGASASISTGSRLGAYDYGTCALSDAGKMLCWGALTASAGAIVPSDTAYTTLSAAFEGACGLTANGTMDCYVDPSLDYPDLMSSWAPLAGTWSKVSGGGADICAISAEGLPACSTVFSGQPSPSLALFDISPGQLHGCGIRQDNKELTCWTFYPDPPLPTAGCLNLYTLGQTNPPSGQYVQVVSGLYHSCAIGVDGTVTCWGAGNPNDTSGYDNCSPPARYNYGQATAPTGTFKQIAAGGYTTCGIKTDGTLACWGAGTTNGNCQSDYGACGQALPPSGTFVEVAVGYTHACAMTAAGKVQCWGSNTGGKATPPAELQ